MKNLKIILIALAAYYTNVLAAPTSPSPISTKEIELTTIKSPNNDEVAELPTWTPHAEKITEKSINTVTEENENENAPHIGIEAKKGRPKEDKKKALKAQQQSDKKIKPKQKLFAEINYSTKASTALPQEERLDATTDEMHDTTVTVSTSIKTAPTTIKSTTLTPTTTMHMTRQTTPAVDQAHSDAITEGAHEVSTTEETTSVYNKDNVIILNNNSSSEGLIIVDVIENFGREENSSKTPTDNSIEIKMDLIDDTTESSRDEIFTTTIETSVSSATTAESSTTATSVKQTISDDIILINEGTTPAPHSAIKWNEMGRSDDIKITFDNIEIPHQNINVSIENGELIIDSIDISVLNRVEEDIRKRANETVAQSRSSNNSLEIVLVEDNENCSTTINNGHHITEQSPTTIHFEIPPKKNEMDGNGDNIKIQTTDKDSDTIFYISNTEVKVIESIPTGSPNEAADLTQVRKPTIYEEDVIVDLPKEKEKRNETPSSPPISARDKYEEDIVLSPLTNDFDPKDINYIGEAFLDVEQSANGAGISENHHIIPLTSDVVIQPVELKDLPNVPIIGEPPSIELAEMMFTDDYDSGVSGNNNIKKQASFRVEEFSPFLLNNRLIKNELQADVPRDQILDTSNSTILSAMAVSPNKTHISVNTMINGTNMTTIASPLANVTAVALDTEEMAENSDLNDIQTLLVACLATLAPLFLCVIIALTIRYCWHKYCGHDSGNDLISDKSTDPLAGKNAGSTDEMKSTESEMTLNRGNGNFQASTELLLANVNGDVVASNGIHNDTNGSIIKMTMKNNHLIVETEERNDISRDTRETKMHYSPSEKDGVFIVEAARGADQNGSHKPSPLLQKSTDAPLEIPEEIKLDTLQSHFTPSSPEEERKQNSKPEQVEVHTPPAEIKGSAVVTQKETDPVICNGTKTGLTSSDLSLTSSNSSNQNYTYGDRESYNCEEKGYRGSSPKRIINVHCHDLKPLIENSPPAVNTQNTANIKNNNINNNDNDKPVITSAIYKNDSQDDVEQLNSDKNACEENANEVKDASKVHAKMNGIIHSANTNGLDEITTVPDENCNDTIVPLMKGIECNGELTMDSLSYLPAPPPDEELTSLVQLDSFPPPPPPESDTAAAPS